MLVVSLEVSELSPGEVRRDDELDRALLEQALHDPDHIERNESTRLCELCLGLLDPALLVVFPGVVPAEGAGVLDHERALLGLRGQAGEDKDWLDRGLFERFQVTLDLSGEGEGYAADG